MALTLASRMWDSPARRCPAKDWGAIRAMAFLLYISIAGLLVFSFAASPSLKVKTVAGPSVQSHPSTSQSRPIRSHEKLISSSLILGS